MKYWRVSGSLVLVGALLAALTACGGGGDDASDDHALTYRAAALEQYQSFVGNWDEARAPVLLAAMQSLTQWDGIMQPAATGLCLHTPCAKAAATFAPAASEFAQNVLLMVARVSPAGASQPFTIEGVTVDGAHLTMRYRYQPPASGSFDVKATFGVWVPKGTYNDVTFIENDKQVGKLDLAVGQWTNVN